MIITYHHQFAWFLPDYILITSMFWKSTPFGLFTCNMDVWVFLDYIYILMFTCHFLCVFVSSLGFLGKVCSVLP